MTKTITVNIPHQLGKAEARRRLKSGIADLRTKHAQKIANVSETWTGDRMDFRVSAMGQSLSGKLEVLDDAIKLDVDLPWLLAALANKLRPEIEREATKMLEKK